MTGMLDDSRALDRWRHARGSRAHPEREFRIRFPAAQPGQDQDEEWFEFDHDGSGRRLRIHDYADIFSVPGLYEALVYEKLRCASPQRVTRLLGTVLADRSDDLADLRVLDLGAGNGIVAEQLAARGVGTVVGLDLLPEAEHAARRDRPGLYRDYVVADLCELDPRDRARLEAGNLNCLVTVAALGFGDIPARAFATAFNLISSEGWVAMTIKEDFLQPREDDSGFARLMRELVDRGIARVQAHLRYCHRLSIAGEKIFYLAIVARKTAHIPQSVIDRFDGGEAKNGQGPAPGSDAASLLLGRSSPQR